MIFALYSEVDASSISSKLGKPQYSYYFLLKYFRAVFEALGTVVVVKEPRHELDKLYRDCMSRDEAFLFVCFT